MTVTSGLRKLRQDDSFWGYSGLLSKILSCLKKQKCILIEYMSEKNKIFKIYDIKWQPKHKWLEEKGKDFISVFWR